MCGDLVSNHGTTGRASIERAEARPSYPILSFAWNHVGAGVVLVQTQPNPPDSLSFACTSASQPTALLLVVFLRSPLPPLPSPLPSPPPARPRPRPRPHPLPSPSPFTTATTTTTITTTTATTTHHTKRAASATWNHLHAAGRTNPLSPGHPLSPCSLPLFALQPGGRRKLLEFSKSDVQDIMNEGMASSRRWRRW